MSRDTVHRCLGTSLAALIPSEYGGLGLGPVRRDCDHGGDQLLRRHSAAGHVQMHMMPTSSPKSRSAMS